MTPYKLLTLFEIHKEFTGYKKGLYHSGKNIDADIDDILKGL